MKSAILNVGLSVGVLVMMASSASAAGLVLNEYSAVKDGEYFDTGASYKGYDHGLLGELAGLGIGSDLRVAGNGDDWIELLVTEDHMDLRGWEVQWFERENPAPYDTTGDVLWQAPYGTDMTTKKHGILTFGDADVWSDLRSGTVITITEDQQKTAMSQVWNGTSFVDNGDVTIDLSTDTSYDPHGGDWHINICTEQEQANYDSDNSYERLIVAETTTLGDTMGQFLVNNDQWAARIVDDEDNLIVGLVGEDLVADPANGVLGWGGGGVNSQEAASLEDPADWTNPSGNDYDDHDYTTFGVENAFSGGSQSQDLSGLRSVIEYDGDVDMDGDVDAEDLASLGLNWCPSCTDKLRSEGDFDLDGDIDAEDLATLGLNWNPAGSVPEPVSIGLLALGGLGLTRFRRRSL